MTDRCIRYSAIILILPLLWRDASTQFPTRYGVLAPINVEVQAGLCVHIPCIFNLPEIYTLSRETRGIWYRGNALTMRAVAVKSDSGADYRRDRLFLTGDVWRGDCSLMINDARQQDADYYTFRFEDVNLKYTFIDFRTFVRVIELSDKPEISPIGTILAGQKVTLSCTSPGRCSGKPPLIVWEGKAKMKTEKIYEISNKNGTTTHHSNITFVPAIEDDGLLLTCTVIYENNVTTSKGVSLSIQDIPSTYASSSDAPFTDAPSTDMSEPICRSLSYDVIAGMVAGNVVVLILIILGTYCFLKKRMEKRLLGKGSGAQGTESTYQDLKGQKNDIYYSIRTQ